MKRNFDTVHWFMVRTGLMTAVAVFIAVDATMRYGFLGTMFSILYLMVTIIVIAIDASIVYTKVREKELMR